MRNFALTALLLAAAASSALATQSIGIYEDPVALDCEISDPGGEVLKTFYIVQTNQVQPSIGSTWKLEWDAGMTMVYVGDSSPFSKLGDAQNGADIYYYVCTGGTFMIDAVTMLSYGTSAPCSRFRLGEHPTRGRTIIFCNFVSVPFTAGEALVNANGSCACNVGTEQTTWGTVKALYR